METILRTPPEYPGIVVPIASKEPTAGEMGEIRSAIYEKLKEELKSREQQLSYITLVDVILKPADGNNPFCMCTLAMTPFPDEEIDWTRQTLIEHLISLDVGLVAKEDEYGGIYVVNIAGSFGSDMTSEELLRIFLDYLTIFQES
jgi:vacuolar-type H+-ATPase subunit E/Vma4